ncbi:MAG: polysaccharide lyase family 8 super-sandwich domain-containing protein [Lachnospiraceae bacterium]|jgi:hyaluronate lyase
MNFQALRKAWQTFLLGNSWNPDTPYGREILHSLDIIADGMGNEEYVPFDSPFTELRARANRWAIKGSRTFHDEDEKCFLLNRLEELYDTEYGPFLYEKEDMNWWDVEIGIPHRALDTLFLLYDVLPDREQTIRKWTDVILHFQDAYKKTSRGREETGANLCWKCQTLVLTGILREDPELIEQAVNRFHGIFRFSHSFAVPGLGKIWDDGFYPDGSFIQHYFFAYTGGYGRHLIMTSASLIYAFRDTEIHFLDGKTENFLVWAVQNAYAPLIYRGHLMDLARGREMSRFITEDTYAGRVVMRAVCYLAASFSRDHRTELEGYLARWMPEEEDVLALFEDLSAGGEYYVQPSLEEVVNDLKKDAVPASGAESKFYNFGVMNKAVYVGRDFSCGVSMFSKNISAYEHLGPDGKTLWHVSDGAMWIYTKDGGSYADGYHAAVDPMRLPGITVDRDPDRRESPLYNWYLPESRNPYAFSGGAALDAFGIAGMEYAGQGKDKTRTLHVKKSWFFFGDAVLCAGSDISDTSEDSVETVLMNRMIKPDDSVTVEKDLIYADDIGILLPEGGNLKAEKYEHSGKWYQDTSKNEVTRTFALALLDHGIRPKNAGYAYIVLPAKSLDDTRKYRENPDAVILAHTGAVHAAFDRKDNVLGINFFAAETKSAFGVTCSGQACLLIKEKDGIVRIAVSDPTKETHNLDLTFDFNAETVLEKDPNIQVKSMDPFSITVSTDDMDGRSMILAVREGGKTWSVRKKE